MYLYVKDNMKTKNQLLKLKDKYEEQLEDMKNKENFLERVTTEKKQLNKRIDKIDKLFNNKELLTKQYAKRNKKFNDMNLETWTTMLKQEREKLLKKINECNLLIKPKEYIKNIESLEYKVKFLSEINEDKIIELCKTFLVGLNQIVKKTEDKKELVEIIYELRYYRFIPYKDKFLKDVEELKISFDEIMKQVIDKACKLRAIQTICEEAEERLRFDFTHPQKMTKEEIQKVEDLVNEQIKKDLKVTCEEMNYEDAKKSGAIGLFTDKYGEKVKVYTIGDFSKEICGGPHVKHTGELGRFKIKKEESSSSGIRRIKAVLIK